MGETGEGQRKKKTTSDYKVLRPGATKELGSGAVGQGWAQAGDSTKTLALSLPLECPSALGVPVRARPGPQLLNLVLCH